MSSIEKKVEERQSPEAAKHKVSFVVPTYTGIEQNGFAVHYSLSKLFQVERKCNECDVVAKSGFSGMIRQKLKKGLTKRQKENLEKLESGEIAWSSSDWNIQSLSCRTQGLLLRTHHRSYAKKLQNQRICLIKRFLQRFSLKEKDKNIRPDEAGIVQKLHDKATCTIIRANVNCSSLAIAKKNFYIISEDAADTICGAQINDYKVSTATATEYIVKDEYVKSCFDFIDAKQGSVYELTSCKEKYIPHLNINEEMETKGERFWYWLLSFFVSSSDTPIAEITNGEIVTECKAQSTADVVQSVHQIEELVENASDQTKEYLYMCAYRELAALEGKCLENLRSDVSSSTTDRFKTTVPSDPQLGQEVPEMKPSLEAMLNDLLFSTIGNDSTVSDGTQFEIMLKLAHELYIEKIEKLKRKIELRKHLNRLDELMAQEKLKRHGELKAQEELSRQEELKTQEGLMRQDELKKQSTLKAQEELRRQEELKVEEELMRQDELKKQGEFKAQEELKRQDELQIHGKLKANEESKRQDELQTHCELKAQEELRRKEELEDELKILEKLTRQDELKRQGELKAQEELTRQEELIRQGELKAKEEIKRQDELQIHGELKAQEELRRQEELEDELKILEKLIRQDELKIQGLEELKAQEELTRQEELKRQEEEEWEVISKQ